MYFFVFFFFSQARSCIFTRLGRDWLIAPENGKNDQKIIEDEEKKNSNSHRYIVAVSPVFEASSCLATRE